MIELINSGLKSFKLTILGEINIKINQSYPTRKITYMITELFNYVFELHYTFIEMKMDYKAKLLLNFVHFQCLFRRRA